MRFVKMRRRERRNERRQRQKRSAGPDQAARSAEDSLRVECREQIRDNLERDTGNSRGPCKKKGAAEILKKKKTFWDRGEDCAGLGAS